MVLETDIRRAATRSEILASEGLAEERNGKVSDCADRASRAVAVNSRSARRDLPSYFSGVDEAAQRPDFSPEAVSADQSEHVHQAL